MAQFRQHPIVDELREEVVKADEILLSNGAIAKKSTGEIVSRAPKPVPHVAVSEYWQAQNAVALDRYFSGQQNVVPFKKEPDYGKLALEEMEKLWGKPKKRYKYFLVTLQMLFSKEPIWPEVL